MTIPASEDLLAHRSFVRALAMALVGDEHDADDVAQDVIATALDRPTPVRSVKAWLAGVTRNVVKMRFRSGRRRTRRESAAARVGAVPSAADSAARIETLGRLVTAVEALAEPYRSVVLLRYFDQMMPAEIARRTETPLATVKSRLRRALARLREHLDEGHGGDRRRWSLLLLPAGAPKRTAAAAGLSTIVPGAILMSTKTKVVTGLVVAALVVVATLTVVISPDAERVPEGAGEGDATAAKEVSAGRDGAGAGTMAERPEASVAGAVVDLRGRRVAGARLTAFLKGEARRVETGKDGIWRISLPASPIVPHIESGWMLPGHRLLVEAKGYAPAVLRLRVPPGHPRQVVPGVILARAAARLTVSVVGPDRRPVRDAEVHLDLPNPNHRFGRLRESFRAPAGSHGPVLVPPGRIIVKARGPGLPEGTTETFAPPGRVRDLVVRVALPESFPAVVHVTDENGTSLAGATVTALTWGRNLWGIGGVGAGPDEPTPPTVVTGKDGRAHLPLARNAQTEVRVAKDGYACTERRIAIRSEMESTVVLHRAGSVEGRVLMADGRPAPAGLIIWAGTEGYDVPRDRRTGPGGTFGIDALVPGKVSVWFHNGPFALGHFDVDLRPGQAIRGVEHRLAPPDTLRGVVREEGSGAPIAGVVVGTADYWAYSTAGIVTDAAGRWSVSWIEPDRPDWKRDVGFSRTGYLPHREIVRAGTGEIEVFLTPGDSPWTHDPEFEIPEPDTEEWSLAITDGAGDPLPGAWVEIGERRKLYRPADGEGRVRIPEDAEHVLACATGHTRLEVRGTERERGTVALEPTLPIRIRVVDRKGRPRAGVDVRVYRPHRLAVTDVEGRVAFDGFPVGRAFFVTASDGLGPSTSVWAAAGEEEAGLYVPRTTRVLVRFDGKPPALGPNEHVECAVYSRERTEPEGGEFDGSGTADERSGDRWIVPCPAEKVVVWFQYPDGPLRAYRLDLSDGAEQTVDYSFDTPEMGAITVLDARGDTVSGAGIRALSGYSHVLSRRPIGRMRLVVEPEDQAPQVTSLLDTTEPNLVRLLPVGTLRVRVLRNGVRFREGKLRIHTEPGAVGGWVHAAKSGDFEVPYGVPIGIRRIEYRPEGGLPRFATGEVTDGRETEVTIRLP